MHKILSLLFVLFFNHVNSQVIENLYTKLIGKWEVTEASIKKENSKMSASESEIFKKSSLKIQNLQTDLKSKNVRLILELNQNGTYKFVVFEKSKATFEEEGSFYVNENILNSSNDNGSESSYENHIILQIDSNSFTAKHYIKGLNNKAFETFKHIRLNY